MKQNELGDHLVFWQSASKFPDIALQLPALDRLVEIVMSGYQRYPWGGVEVGGVLFGKKESDGIYITAVRPIDCEHAYGPAFDLSTKDLDVLERILPRFSSESGLAGLEPIGWYYSVSRQGPSLGEGDQGFHDRFFPGALQIAMILKRAKAGPVEIGLFSRDSSGSLQVHSPRCEFRVENFRLHIDELPIAAPDPELATPIEPPPSNNGAAAPVPIDVARDLRTPEPMEDSGNAEPPGVSELVHESSSQLLTFPVEPENPYAGLGLVGDPFSPTPNTRFFDPSPKHREALASLIGGIQSRKGFLGLIGPPGTGKSMLLECLIEQLREQKIEFAFLFNSKITLDQFFELFAIGLKLRYRSPTKTSVLIALNEYLARRTQDGQITVLIVDNAQKLRADVLEEIELLGNLENRQGPMIQVVFAAQPTFERQLEKPELKGLRQRLLCRARLGPLTSEQTASYIVSRLAKCGIERQTIFSRDLLLEIHARAQGIPRLINAVCWNLLTLCAEDKRAVADMPMLERVSAELELDRLNDDPSESAAVFA